MIPPNASKGIVPYSFGWCGGGSSINVVALRPTIPTHLVVQVIHCNIQQIQVGFHYPTWFLRRIADCRTPTRHPISFNFVSYIIREISFVFLNEQGNCQDIAVSRDVTGTTTCITYRVRAIGAIITVRASKTPTGRAFRASIASAALDKWA